MYFFYHKRRFPNDVLVCIEEFNKQKGTVLFDFIDLSEYNLFNTILNVQKGQDKPSMVLLNDYKGRTIRENTIYSIKPEIIQNWRNRLISSSEDLNSFLIGFVIDITKIEDEIFGHSVSINDFFYRKLNYIYGEGNISKIPLPKKGKIRVTVRNVGQGNWNEVSFNNKVKVVYDVGAPMNASKTEIVNIIGNKNNQYGLTKPILILSHWDKDHYHSLLGMSDAELRNNFSAFVCRDKIPNLTSKRLFDRISTSVGFQNIYAIQAGVKQKRGGSVFFKNMNPETENLVIYNAEQHKNRNISGLVLSVRTNRKSIILSGDAHYEQISRDILQRLNYPHKHNLVVPHHGGKAGNYHYNTPKQITLDKAIISVGVNPYGHPFTSYIGALQASGFKVQQTNIVGGDITINL